MVSETNQTHMQAFHTTFLAALKDLTHLPDRFYPELAALVSQLTEETCDTLLAQYTEMDAKIADAMAQLDAETDAAMHDADRCIGKCKKAGRAFDERAEHEHDAAVADQLLQV